MNGTGRAWIRIAVTGILFLLLFSGACAAAETKVTAGCPGLCGAQVVSRKKNEDMVLCLRRSPDEDEIKYNRSKDFWENNRQTFINIVNYKR